MKNCGKQFEKNIREQLQAIRGVSVDRINDNVGFKGAYNIADLIVYRRPYKYYFELKTIKGTSFPFGNINEKALMDMQHASLISGVGCYFIIWFVDLDLTICINAIEIFNQMYAHDRKSIGVKSFDNFDYIVVNGKKKQKYYKYDLKELLDKLDGEMIWRR